MRGREKERKRENERENEKWKWQNPSSWIQSHGKLKQRDSSRDIRGVAAV